jgi:octanoyl-[GcvH]:protein N-octanoyltransferase
MLFFDAGFTEPPELDTAVSHAMLLRVARGEMPASIRVHRPGSVVAFGRQDIVQTGYEEAVAAAEALGFAAVERLAGGRAAVFHPGTIAFSMTVPVDDPRSGITERFVLVAEVMRDAFRSLGADAQIGEVPGEYCPGAYSVNIGGTRKVMGVGQRIIAGAAHVGGVAVATDGALVSKVLVPVYQALDISWDPSTSGDLSSTGAAFDDMVEAIVHQFGRRYSLAPGAVDGDTMALAASLRSSHLPSGRSAR